MKEIKNGYFVIYHGQEYQTGFWEKIPGMVRLSSWNKKDLDNGFYCMKSREYMEKFGFRCQKEVSKSEITEAYEIRTHAVYKGVGASITRSLKPGCIRLATTCLYWLGEDRDEFLKKVTNAGFEYTDTEQGGYKIYEKEVSLDDPDLQLEEIRTELDISKL